MIDRKPAMHLASLFVHPLKSAAALAPASARVTPQGLEHDREWMLVRADDHRFVTAREWPQLTQVRVAPNAAGLAFSAGTLPPGQAVRADYTSPLATGVWGDDFEAFHGDAAADAWFSEYLGTAVKLVWLGESRRKQKTVAAPLSFADGYPFLLIGQGSLNELNRGLPQPVTMRHFRPNLVIADTLAYEEDDWAVVRIGEVVFDVVKPCTRCVLTTVDPATGVPDAAGEPLQTLMRTRRFDDGVHFGQNLVARNTGVLREGDELEVLESRLEF